MTRPTNPYSMLCIVLLLGASLLQAAIADESQSGEDLQQANCMSCHGDDVYTREDRFVKSLGSLRTQVQRCDTTLGLGWFDEELDKVTGYLNNKYYHFK